MAAWRHGMGGGGRWGWGKRRVARPVAGGWRGSWAGIGRGASGAVTRVLCGVKRMARKLPEQRKTPGTLRRRGLIG